MPVRTPATHRLPLTKAPHAYEMFRRERDGAVKILIWPWPWPWRWLRLWLGG
ncbi:hypothetical protein [Streptomyces spinosus]|uniref:hypothetical protein n=1 Tax=Streptomyces spinosus TaxID=2872623 RepID=UPI001CED3FCF|nr:hypothetical protein [Streptomyces spinosus]